MPSERKSKEDTWTPSELKKAMGKDTIRKEREERKKERMREEQNGEDKHRRKKEEDDTRERRHHKDEDDKKGRKDKERSHKNDDEEERERQRRERREKREGKPRGDDDRKKTTEDEDRNERRKHRDEEREKEKRNKDDERDKDRDRRRKDDERDRERRDKDERRKHRDDDDKRRNDDGDRRKHRDDEERRKHKDGDDRERRKHNRDEDDRDRRKEKDRDRHKETEEEERERQRRERREKRDGKDKDKDREKDKDRDREKRKKDEDVKSAVNGSSRSKVTVEKEEESNGYDDYEDDFEDYEEDFEEEDEEEEVPQGKDDEMNQVLRALDEENERLYNDSKKTDRYSRDDSSDDRGQGHRDDSPDEPVTRSRPKSSGINFLSAKRQVMSQQAYGKTSKRARDLLQMIELDTVSFDIMDLPPVKEYELYIRSFGRSDTRQAYVQTNDDAIERDIQTDEIDMRSKWTQHPAEDFAGSGRGDGEKDFQEEEQSQMNKQQDLGRLSKFLQQAGQVVSILLDEERSPEKTGELSANKSKISMSEGYTELSMLSILQGRHVEFAYFAPTQPNMLLTVYSKPVESNPSNPVNGNGIICVWNTNEPSYPQRILACESQPRCCCFSPYKTSVAFAGMVDGSICAWDLREPPSLHKSVEYDKKEHLLRFPTYNTAGILESENHISPVTTINPVITYLDEDRRQESDSEESGVGMSFQLVSSEDQGTINFWVVAELSNADIAGSEIDLGLSPGGKIKVVISSSIKLDTLVREARTLGPVRSFEMQISPTDPNHFYIGTDGGYVLHGLRFGNRAFPRTFTTLSDTPVDVRNIDFSPFGHPCFLVTTEEGCVHLFGTKTAKPLLSWPSKIWGTRNLKCVRWSRSRPCVFYVLDDRSQLYTFDILEGDAMPVKMESLSKEVNVACISFTSHIKVTGRHPQMLVSLQDGTVQIHTISKEYREQQTLENDFLPSYLEKF